TAITLHFPVTGHAHELPRQGSSPKLSAGVRGRWEMAGPALAISHDDCTPLLSATLLIIEKPPVTVARLRTEILNHLRNATGGSVTRTVHDVKAPTFSAGDLEVAWIHYSETRSPAWYAGGGLEETHHHSIFILKKAELI